jgi:large subunit ribosomal protein L23
MAFFDRFKRGYKSKKDEAKRESKVDKSKVQKSAVAPREKPAVAKVEPPVDTIAHRVLLHPIVSEKTARIEPAGQYVFAVSTDANKVEIKKAIERHYRVHVSKVNVMNVSGKSVRYGRTFGKRSDWRKAYVTLKDGETLVY